MSSRFSPRSWDVLAAVKAGAGVPQSRTQILASVSAAAHGSLRLNGLNILLKVLCVRGALVEMKRDQATGLGADTFHRVPSTRYYVAITDSKHRLEAGHVT
ncbi:MULTISPECIES: hypothetical protein [unclassified Crossiella]|uniref:hypothetical protein n=1 Tax=unclassified Crossiella TaxID=2620835 RepID=UPI001FFEC763|nr:MULTISPECIES: hypothetical protein [unclassified Crossiella]MCK2240037.1 hypothetical protein [Crossiella sp. S99.2]MCK2252745.1 hypothetical protein [Crossiella sp. S99.1]